MNKKLLKEILFKILHVVLVGLVAAYFLYPIFGWNMVRYPLAIFFTYAFFFGIYKLAIRLGLDKKTRDWDY